MVILVDLQYRVWENGGLSRHTVSWYALSSRVTLSVGFVIMLTSFAGEGGWVYE